MADIVNISGLDKAEILAALYNAAVPIGMGVLQYNPTPWTREDAQLYIDANGLYFDYVLGRPIKSNLDGDEFRTTGYNRDQGGPGTAESIIYSIRKGEGPNNTYVQYVQDTHMPAAVAYTRSLLQVHSHQEGPGRFVLGMGELADKVNPILENMERS